jgi:endonuclease/exonuclease/phosphatase family metal-dependent hydrolase
MANEYFLVMMITRTALAFVLSALFLLSCDPFRTTFDDPEDAVLYEATNLTAPPAGVDTLKVMTWNIKFAGGRIDFFYDCYGDRTLMTEEEVRHNLEGLAAKINQFDPDIVLLQEVDVESKRCAYVDNLQWLLDHTGLNYGAYASQWKADFIPSDGIGRMNSGNAVMSRWEITEAKRIALPLISDQDALKQYFYLRRNILKTLVSVHGHPLYVLCVHTAAFSHDGTKKKHIDQFKQECDVIEAAGGLFIAGGDLNEIPPGAKKVSDFPDSKCTDEDYQADDYSGETAWLNDLYDTYEEAVPRLVYQADENPYFTHTTDKHGFWNRRLDYLFTNGSFVAGSGTVHQDDSTGMATMPLSDHAPVTVRMVLP